MLHHHSAIRWAIDISYGQASSETLPLLPLTEQSNACFALASAERAKETNNSYKDVVSNRSGQTAIHEDDRFCSFSFPRSRLLYLCLWSPSVPRRLPLAGLLLIHWHHWQQCRLFMPPRVRAGHELSSLASLSAFAIATTGLIISGSV